MDRHSYNAYFVDLLRQNEALEKCNFVRSICEIWGTPPHEELNEEDMSAREIPTSTSRVLSTGGRDGGKLPPPKSFTEKKITAFFKIKIFFDNDFKKSVKVTNVQEMRFQPILNNIFSKFSGPP